MSVNKQGVWRGVAVVLALAWVSLASPSLMGQGCTTQAKMSDAMRSGLSGAALKLANEVKGSQAAKVQADTMAEFATDAAFAATASLIEATAAKVSGDSLQVTQICGLDAQGRKAGDTSDADFSCVLMGTTSEADFSIAALPPGMYGFAMVEATGERPFLLAFLLRQEGDLWKMAGFYPRARTAAGHDGGWFWSEAYKDFKAKEPWLAWVLFGEADQLLRPANFATSTKLDSLRSERRSAAPPELAEGISGDNPLVLKGSNGAEYRFTSIDAEGSEDGKQLNLMLHLRGTASTNVEAAKSANRDAAKTLLDEHKELRQGFDKVLVFAETPGQPPLVTEETIQAIQ